MDLKPHYQPPTASVSNRKFGFTVGGILTVLGLCPLLKQHPPIWVLLGIGGVLLLLALVFPRRLTVFNRLWMALGDRLHRIVSPLLLGFVFFAVITPMGLLRRVFHKDPLQLRFRPDLSSYWQPRAQDTDSHKSLRNLF